MSRSIQLQILRGTQAQLQTLQNGTDPDTGAAVSPLQMGEMFFATDTQQFYIGCPTFGQGYIQVANLNPVLDVLQKQNTLLEAIRRALVTLALDGGRANPIDFDVSTIARDMFDDLPQEN